MKIIEHERLYKSLTLPIIFAFAAITLNVIWWAFNLPRDEKLIAVVKGFFDKYGFVALFVSAILEGALVVGFYYPGAFVIFLSVIIAGRDLMKVATVVGVVSVAFVIGLTLDYFLGKYGWHKLFLKLGFRQEMNKAEKRLRDHGLLAIFLTYWDINIASFTATAAGILNYPYFSFLAYSVPAIVIWNSFWATLIYLIGQNAIQLVSGKASYAIAIVTVWMLVILVKHVIENVKTR